MSDLWSAFLPHVPRGGTILDAGCGSGRDALHFKSLGYQVTAFDASAEMVRLAGAHTGLRIEHRRLQDVDDDGTFNGVWCCAAALHVAGRELPDVVNRLHRALKPGGVCYLSFKYGRGERREGTRTFFDLEEDGVERLFSARGDREIIDVWRTDDARADCATTWLNILSRRLRQAP